MEITGNLASVRVQKELFKLFKKHNSLNIIDIGCVGLKPFQLWEPFITILEMKGMKLFGIDVAYVNSAKKLIEKKGWKNVELRELNAYKLSNSFQFAFFDIIVSTQVLEHIANLRLFLEQIKKIVKKSGIIFLTFDSAYYGGKYCLKNPKTFSKRLVKLILSKVGNEKHYEIPLYDYEVEKLFDELDFKIIEKRFYNLHPLKLIHNHKISERLKDEFLSQWLEIEEILNNDQDFIRENKNYFLGIYYKLISN